MRKGTAALALAFLALHLPFLPSTLEDVDSINFALGVADFDVARHQPHPPGYPVFVALGKVSTPLLRMAHIPSSEPRGLAVWSALAGAALIPILFALFRGVESLWRGLKTPPYTRSDLARAGTLQGGADQGGVERGLPPSLKLRRTAVASAEAGQTPPHDAASDWRALWATAIVALSPLFWFTALRPLSDMAGLAAAAAAQALIVSVIAGCGSPRALLWGAFAAGLAIGVRSQTSLLTLPLLAAALIVPHLGLRMFHRIATLAALSVGLIVWAVPLTVASGGLSAYAAALGSQAGEDFSGVVMLWTMRNPRVAVDAMTYSFLWPWGQPAAGMIVITLAVVGAVRVGWRMPRVFGLVALGYAPYATFHLLFHEPVTVRYALPLLVPVAYFVVCALEWPRRSVLHAGALALTAWSLIFALPAAAAYARGGSPTFRALRDAAGEGVGGPPESERVIAIHAVARRAVEWLGTRLPVRVLTGPHGREWLTLVDHWKSNPRSVVSFVADPRRTDLVVFDPAARSGPRPYRWGFIEPPAVGGVRPGNSDVYEMHPPGWMLDRGWAITAEIAGITARDGAGPHKRPSVAWIRPRQEEATLMLGGRHLGSSADPAVRIAISVGGRSVEISEANAGFFFRLVTLPPGALGGPPPYLPLEVKADSTDGSRPDVPVGLEQFDLQPPGIPMVGADEGWHEPEYDPFTARSWRWTTERAVLWVRPVDRDVTLTLRGESPMRYYDAPPVVTVTVDRREVSRFSPSSDFTHEVVLPVEALASARGRVLIESDKWFVPGDHDASPDRRHLALRIYSYSVR